MRLRLSGSLAYIDKYGRAIIALDDDSAAQVVRVTRDATPEAFPVRCKIPPYEYVGRKINFTVISRKYSFISTAAHNAGELIEGFSFRMERVDPVHA